MAKCFVCRKGTLKGYRVSHSDIKTRRFFKPNLHVLRVQFQNKIVKQIKLCSKCYKKIKNDFWERKKQAFIPISLLNQAKIKKPLAVKAKPNGKEKGSES